MNASQYYSPDGCISYTVADSAGCVPDITSQAFPSPGENFNKLEVSRLDEL